MCSRNDDALSDAGCARRIGLMRRVPLSRTLECRVFSCMCGPSVGKGWVSHFDPCMSARPFCTTHRWTSGAASRSTESNGEDASLLQLKCPECGKRFLSLVNLQQHRRSRHLVELKSPSRELLERLREVNVQLQAELQELQEMGSSKGRCASSALECNGEWTPVEEDKNRGHFHAAVPCGRVYDMSVDDLNALRDHRFRLGTGASEIRCVGVVEDDVTVGHLGDTGDADGNGLTAERLEVLQFTLRTEGHRQQRVGQLKMYRNCLTVRVVGPRWKIESGDVVLLTGTYGLHKSHDIVARRTVENTVVEAAYVGLLQKRRGDAAKGRW